MTDDERREFTEVKTSLAKIETALCGNGTKGLGERMSDSEGWQEKHEAAHRLYIEDLHDYRLKREQKEADDAKKKTYKALAFVGSITLIIVGQFLISII